MTKIAFGALTLTLILISLVFLNFAKQIENKKPHNNEFSLHTYPITFEDLYK